MNDFASTHNLPSDPFEALMLEIEDKTESADAWLIVNEGKAKTKKDADRARNMEAEIHALLKRADDMHKAEKEPHLKAGQAVDKKFSFRKDMEPMKKRLKAAWGFYAAEEERRLRAEAEAKAAEERKRVEAERARIEAEQRKLMEENPVAALTQEPPPMPEMPAAAPEVKVNVGGGVGSRGGLTTVWLAEITDWQAAAAFYADNSLVRDAVERVANAHAKRDKENAEAPGVAFKSERVAR